MTCPNTNGTATCSEMEQVLVVVVEVLVLVVVAVLITGYWSMTEIEDGVALLHGSPEPRESEGGRLPVSRPN